MCIHGVTFVTTSAASTAPAARKHQQVHHGGFGGVRVGYMQARMAAARPRPRLPTADHGRDTAPNNHQTVRTAKVRSTDRQSAKHRRVRVPRSRCTAGPRRRREELPVRRPARPANQTERRSDYRARQKPPAHPLHPAKKTDKPSRKVRIPAQLAAVPPYFTADCPPQRQRHRSEERRRQGGGHIASDNRRPKVGVAGMAAKAEKHRLSINPRVGIIGAIVAPIKPIDQSRESNPRRRYTVPRNRELRTPRAPVMYSCTGSNTCTHSTFPRLQNDRLPERPPSP